MMLQKILPALGLAAAGVMMLGVSGAFAASSSPQGWGGPQNEQYNVPGVVRQNGRICERICPSDSSPCDPLNFKIADGRCRGVMSSPR